MIGRKDSKSTAGKGSRGNEKHYWNLEKREVLLYSGRRFNKTICYNFMKSRTCKRI